MPMARAIQIAVAGVVVIAGALGPRGNNNQLPTQPTATRQGTVEYMPLVPGRVMTYANAGGDSFTLTFEAPKRVVWFDDTVREVVPVHDTRCDCRFMFRREDGEVWVIGVIWPDRMERWGEPVVVFPAGFAGSPETITTPAGRFDAAQVGQAWFAPGVGMVRIDDYSLVSAKSIH